MNCNTKYAEKLQYLFCCLDWLERKVVNSTKKFFICKCFQSDISVGQLTNTYNGRNMITEDQLFASLTNACCTSQYYYNMVLDVLGGMHLIGQILNYDERREF